MLTPLVFWQQGNVKKSEKMVKMVNIEQENLHIFWTSCGISMNFSGKMSLMIISKVTKSQDLTLSLKIAFLEKPQWGSNWPPPPSSSRFRVKVEMPLPSTSCIAPTLSFLLNDGQDGSMKILSKRVSDESNCTISHINRSDVTIN